MSKTRPMRTLYVTLSTISLLALAACGPRPDGATGTNAATNAAAAPSPATGATLPPVASAHSGGAAQQPAQPAQAPSNPSVDTKALDAKIEQAETKAKATGASDADKRAAAAAFVERGNVYYSAGTPSLYKFALGDFRRALKYDPANSEARDKMTQIVQIYESMGRPVPTNGLEQ